MPVPTRSVSSPRTMFFLVGTVAVGTVLAAATVRSSTGDTDAHQAARQVADRLAGRLHEGDYDGLKMELWKVAVDEAVVGELGDQLAEPYKRLTEALGARTKVELLSTEEAGPSIVRFVYGEFHTRGVVVWRFEFFKPAEQWKLHAYQFGPLRMESADPLHH